MKPAAFIASLALAAVLAAAKSRYFLGDMSA